MEQKYEAVHYGQFCFCVGDFRQFPFSRVRLYSCGRENHARMGVVKDLESDCLQNYPAAMCLPGNDKEGKVQPVVMHSCMLQYYLLKAFEVLLWPKFPADDHRSAVTRPPCAPGFLAARNDNITVT